MLLVLQFSYCSWSSNLPLLRKTQASSVLCWLQIVCKHQGLSKVAATSPSLHRTQKDSTPRSHSFYNSNTICMFKPASGITHHMADLEGASKVREENLLTAGFSLSFLPPLFSSLSTFSFLWIQKHWVFCWTVICASMHILTKILLCHQCVGFITLYRCWNLICQALFKLIM